MALGYKARKRWALVILVLGVPAYIVSVVTVLNLFEINSILMELVVYIALGIIWIFPFKSIFRGIGQEDPDRTDEG